MNTLDALPWHVFIGEGSSDSEYNVMVITVIPCATGVGDAGVIGNVGNGGNGNGFGDVGYGFTKPKKRMRAKAWQSA